jgi:putative photosynthetic complex assembly protein
MDIASPTPAMQRQILPKHIALVLGLVMLATLILVAVVRYSGVDIRYADSPSQQVRLLRFADMDNGDIGVINAQDGSELARFSGEQGFMRGALRAMARERKRRDIGPMDPFELHARTDGRLTLIDPATHMRLDLESFGPTNAGLFAQLLQDPPAPKTISP